MEAARRTEQDRGLRPIGDEHPCGSPLPKRFHGGAEIDLASERMADRSGQFFPIRLHKQRSAGKCRDELRAAGVDDRRAGGALEEVAVDRRGGAGGERSREHDRGGPRHRPLVARHESGQLPGGDRRGILDKLRRPPRGVVEERRAAAGVGGDRHGDKLDSEPSQLHRRPSGGRPPHHRHRSASAPEGGQRHRDIEHLATGAAPHLAGPIDLAGFERRKPHDRLPGRRQPGGHDGAGGRAIGCHGRAGWWEDV